VLKLTELRLTVRGAGRYLLAAALALELMAFMLIIAGVLARRQANQDPIFTIRAGRWMRATTGGQ
jgi:hypothetical protein